MDSIREIIGDVLKEISSKRLTLSIRILKIWEKIIDNPMASHTRIEEFKGGILMVNVDSSAWLFQINLKKKKILGGLQQEIPEIKSILFKIGKTQ